MRAEISRDRSVMPPGSYENTDATNRTRAAIRAAHRSCDGEVNAAVKIH